MLVEGGDYFKAFYNKNMSPSTPLGQLPVPCEFYVYYNMWYMCTWRLRFAKKMSEEDARCIAILHSATLYTPIFPS